MEFWSKSGVLKVEYLACLLDLFEVRCRVFGNWDERGSWTHSRIFWLTKVSQNVKYPHTSLYEGRINYINKIKII